MGKRAATRCRGLFYFDFAGDRLAAADPRHADAGGRAVGHQRQALSGTIIDVGQNAAAAVGELVRHKFGAITSRSDRNQHRTCTDRRLAARRQPIVLVLTIKGNSVLDLGADGELDAFGSEQNPLRFMNSHFWGTTR